MRIAIAFVLACSLVGLGAWAQGVVLDQTDVKTLSNCAANGSTPAAVVLAANRKYVMTVTGEDTTVCLSATCSSGGSLFPIGTVIRIATTNATTSATCRSAGASGDVEFTWSP